MSDFLIEMGKPKQSIECIGRKYKYTENSFVNSDGTLIYKKQFRMMRKQSCKGCEHCGWLDEDIANHFSEKDGVLLPDNPVHGKLYEIKCVDYYKDWETGIVEDYTLGFVEANDEASSL